MVHYYGYNGIKYDVEKLWHITKKNPVTEMETSKFQKMISSKPWQDGSGKRIGPQDVIEHQDDFLDHQERIKIADLKYPILIDIDNQIIDGFHRIAKAYQESFDKIPVKYVSPEQLHYALYDNSQNRLPKLAYSPSLEPVDEYLPLVDSKKHGRVVFGSPYRWMALVMGCVNTLGQHWGINDIEVGIVTENDTQFPLIKELRPGAFEEFLTTPVYLHTVNAKQFTLHDGGPLYCYYTCHEKVKVIRSDHIPNPKQWLVNHLGDHFIPYGY